MGITVLMHNPFSDDYDTILVNRYEVNIGDELTQPWSCEESIIGDYLHNSAQQPWLLKKTGRSELNVVT